MLYYRQSGHGQPLVLLHGLFGSLENLGAVARPLQQNFNVFSLDLPNHGRSDHAEGMDLRAMAAAVARWMDELALTKAHIVGHSLGGKVAMELALAKPDRVERLVVMDIAPVTYSARHDDVFAGLCAVDPDKLESREQADTLMKAHVSDLAVRSFLLKNLVKTETGFRWRMNLADLQRQYPSLIEGNREGRFDGETLFLKGGSSDYISEAHREAIVGRFAKAQLKVVPGAGHWLHAEKPELVARLIIKFLTENHRGQNA